MIIAVVSQKGGTGKTTVATNLAACYAAEGQEVMLVDADPQHSALDWKADRPPALPQVHALHLPEKNLFQEVQHLSQKYALVIIDGGGRITATARAAVAAADFLILPTLPSKKFLRDQATHCQWRVSAGGGAWGGHVLDSRLGTDPWLLLVGALLGIAAGFYHFFSVVLRK